MKTHFRILWTTLIGSVAAAVALSPPAAAQEAEGRQAVQVAQSDCYSIGQQVASEKGGTLAKASQAEQDGRAVCVIVVLVPGKNGQRPRRTEIVVPQ